MNFLVGKIFLVSGSFAIILDPSMCGYAQFSEMTAGWATLGGCFILTSLWIECQAYLV